MPWLAIAIYDIGKELGNARLITVMDKCFSPIAIQQLLPGWRQTTCQVAAAVAREYATAEQGKVDD